ncbi:MAG TPA: hypothetical protein VGO43_13615 [Pyrinomonadaceae bacterium]|jgi:hypothetical protein|nr:hypothetical protein [Pyrinomonadaceae bacterium]
MSEITIKITDRTGAKFAGLEKGVERFVKKGIGYLEGEIKGSMAKPKHGRSYKRGGKVHIASAKGESPAIDSSNYIGSIQQVFPSPLEGLLGTNASADGFPYPVWLEEKMERPLWEFEAKEALPTLEQILRQEVHGV